MFAKAKAFLSQPAVSHFLAGAFGALASYFATGHVDLSSVLKGGQP